MPATLQAEAAVKDGRYLDATAIYEKYSATQPWFPAAYYLQAEALLSAGRTDLVRKVLAEARTKIPRTAALYLKAADRVGRSVRMI